MRTWSIALAILGLVIGLPGCGGGGDDPGTCVGSFCKQDTPVISVAFQSTSLAHNTEIRVNAGLVVAGQEASVGFLEVRNVGDQGELVVREFSVAGIPATAFRLEPLDGGALPTDADPWRLQPEDNSRLISLFYRREGSDTSQSGTITVRSNTLEDEEGTTKQVMTFPIVVEEAEPSINVPPMLDFGNVSQGEVDSLDLPITNIGNDDLIVHKFHLDGASFALVDGQGKWQGSPETMQGVTFVSPITIPPGSSHVVKVQFSPEDPDPAYGELRFFSNDPDPEKATQGAIVKLQGNVGGPCLAINPKKVDFGGKLIGNMATIEVQVLSCGDAPVEIRELRLLDDAEMPDISLSQDFSLDLAALPGAPENPGAGLPWELTEDDTPVTLGVNESATFTVQFVPDEINPKDENGKPIPDISFIRVLSNTFVNELTVEVKGFGVEVECPTAVIKVQEGEEVIPQTKLHLIGSQSYASSGSIAKYEWTVEQPPGSASVFLPSAAAPDPTFEANVAGAYLFRLAVWDENMVQSCIYAEYQVIVTPDEAIHVELLWHTPNDPDETDEGPEAGADLDLHFLHPFATGLDVDGDGQPDGYFDNPFDCFWFNPAPDWGSHDPMVDDDPGLDRDDTDGAGPENVNLNVPEDGLEYRVGVHYWNDHGWGPSLATVRVYIMSVLVFQVEEVELVNHDLWEVATVAWPSGAVVPITDAGGGHKIIPNYEHPLFLGQ